MDGQEVVEELNLIHFKTRTKSVAKPEHRNTKLKKTLTINLTMSALSSKPRSCEGEALTKTGKIQGD